MTNQTIHTMTQETTKGERLSKKQKIEQELAKVKKKNKNSLNNKKNKSLKLNQINNGKFALVCLSN